MREFSILTLQTGGLGWLQKRFVAKLRLMQVRQATQFLMFLPMLLLAVSAIGCSEPALISRVEFSSEDYNRVYDNSVSVIREQRMVPDREDRRFGVVTSKPFEASHLLNAFRGDHSTFQQVMESSGNYQRRVVKIYIRPINADADEVSEPGIRRQIIAYRENISYDPVTTQPTSENSIQLGPYEVRVEVVIERWGDPYRQLGNHYKARFPITPGRVEREIPDEWYPYKDDPHMADRIVRLIALRSGLLVPGEGPDQE